MSQLLRRTVGILATTVALASTLAACGDDNKTASSASSRPASVPTPDATPFFSEPFDDDANGWGVIDSPDYGTAAYEGGDYVWNLTGRIGHLVPDKLADQMDAGKLTLADVVVNAKGTIDVGLGVAGVFCRETPDTDADFQWYEFVVRDGYAAIRLTDVESNIKVLAKDTSIALPLEEEFELTGACIGDTLSMAINGKPVLQVRDDKLTDGMAGVEAFTYPIHAVMKLRWHDFSVSKA
jgi:hypothetical protein